jgi:hypothetical protein
MRNLWKLINGQLVNISSRQTGTLNNGYTVSGYYALPDDILRAEGWKPLTVEQMPEIEGVQYEAYYEETENEIRKKWRECIPVEE